MMRPARTPCQRGRLIFLSAPILLVLIGACRGDVPPPGAPEPQSVTVHPTEIHQVGLERIESGPVVSGTLAPVREALLSARVTGRVVETFADEGQRIARGARVARIDDGSLREAVLSARSALRAAEGDLEDARRNAERADSLLEAGAIPRQELERARSEVTRAEAQLADARSRLALAQEDLDETTVHAPFAGIVASRQASAGDLVQPGTPILRLVDLGRLELQAAVPAQYLADLRVGAAVAFTVSGFPDRLFSGTIERISPAADPVTRQLTIFVAVPNDDGLLAAGLFAEGRLTTEVRDTVAVPFGALDEVGPEATVMRISADGRAERVPVRLGVRDDRAERAEVTDGLSPGDRVMLGAARLVAPGTPVRIEAAPERAAAGQ